MEPGIDICDVECVCVIKVFTEINPAGLEHDIVMLAIITSVAWVLTYCNLKLRIVLSSTNI